MEKSKSSILMTAALAGLIAGSATAMVTSGSNTFRNSSSSTSSMLDDKKEIEKHACKGMNSCKGQGGGDKKHWGKNECKGKGACATDGSKPKMGK